MEQNNYEQNRIQPPIVEEKKQKNNTGLIIFLVLVILVLVGYIVYTKITEQPQSSTNNPITTNSDDNSNNKEITYTKEKKELITYKYEIDGEGNGTGKLKEYTETIYIDYYLFNSNNEEINNMNNTILNNINNIIEENKKGGHKITKQSVKNEECCYVTEDENGTLTNYQTTLSMFYDLIEDDDYIVLAEYEHVENYGGTSGFANLKNVYTINKKTGKLVPHIDYINSKPEIMDLKKSLYDELVFLLEGTTAYNEDEKKELKNKIKNALENKEFVAYYKDDELTIIFDQYDEEYAFTTWYYNEENGWSADY